MKKLTFLLLSILLISFYGSAKEAPVAIAIHGGAGTILPENLTPELELAYQTKLTEAVKTGYGLLHQGVAGEKVVVEVIKIMEQSPLFNAGIGAVYTFDGHHELDASIMHGGTKNAGAVAGVKTIASPIMAALAVMNNSVHVLLSGEGAEAFAVSQGMTPVDNSLFNTERRWQGLQRAKKRMLNAGLSHGGQQGNERFGTVGAVVLDRMGNIVAGTSTGGMTAKRYGRIGDAPIIGAGTYADNTSCAVSSTGHGEYFIRYNVAADVCARKKYKGISLQQAVDEVIHGELVDAGGDGGVIAVDVKGNLVTEFNTTGMYRATMNAEGELAVGIYKNWIEM
jgi:beta-aspartyl-peptidase (threonine type)